jgi:hypothetical protein
VELLLAILPRTLNGFMDITADAPVDVTEHAIFDNSMRKAYADTGVGVALL